METLLYKVYTDKHGNLIYTNDKGKVHRTDRPAVEYADGSKMWFQNDKRCRTNGPAVEWSNGSKEWWVDGKLHRTDGPAIERANGTKEYWINGKELTEKEFLKRTTVQELTIDEIALKLGIPVEVLKIKK